MEEKKRIVVVTNTKDYDYVDFNNIWNEIIKEKLEEKYGKIIPSSKINIKNIDKI